MNSSLCFFWLEWPSNHQCTIQKILFWDFMDKMKLSPRGQFNWSVFFFSWEQFFYHFFFGSPLTPSFFLGSSYLPPLTYRASSYQPTSPPTSVCAHFHRLSFRPRESLSSSKLQERKIHNSFKGWELQECPSKRSFNVVAAGAQKQE